MRKQKVIKIAFPLVIFLTLVFSFQHHFYAKADEEEIDIESGQEVTWHKNDDLTFNKPVYVNPGGTLIIEKGAEVKFGRDQMGDDAYLSVSGGKVIAEGTEKEPIKITSTSHSNYFLVEFRYDSWNGIPEAEPSFFRYVEISKGGYVFENGGGSALNNEFRLFPTAYADSEDGLPAVSFEGGKIKMENCSFFDNEYADIGAEQNIGPDSNHGDYLIVANSNFLKNGEALAAKSDIYCNINLPVSECQSGLTLKNDWYGDPSGPSDGVLSEFASGKKVIGKLNIDSWRKKELIADPAVVIPGITGSATQYAGGVGELKLDPILHTYDNLIFSLEKNGYEEGKNLFEFPYEWRNSNFLTADELKKKINAVKNETGVSRVDLVAHSMGGLISRYYIESPIYQNDVDQLITLGTPHKGSPEAYIKWEAGESFFTPLDLIAKKLFQLEAHALGYDNLKEYIQSRVKSVQELLPDYNYLYDVSTSEIRNYPDNYPTNPLLDFINKEEYLANLEKVNFVNIIGETDNENSTVGKFRVVESTESEKWEHGMPENFYNSETSQGMEYVAGDETVPLASAEGIKSSKEIPLNSVHNDLPTEAQCDVFDELTGKTECEHFSTFDRVVDILTFSVFSPIDIQVVAPDGKRAGKDLGTGETYEKITGAYCTQYDTGEKFLTIPNPSEGDYRILTQGTDNGQYRIEIARVSEGVAGKTSEATAEISGTAQTGVGDEKKLVVEENNIVAENSDTTPPVITGTATTPPNTNSWYSSDVTIHFEAQDSESGIDSVTPDVILSAEGADQSATGTAIDKAGNSASFTVSGINIDKTAPEISISSPESKDYPNNQVFNFEYNANDNLSGIESQNAFLDGKEFSEKSLDLSLAKPGSHIFNVAAEDRAGNKKEQSVEFKITTNISAIADNISHYWDLGMIRNRRIKDCLRNYLLFLDQGFELITKIENNPKIPDNFKDRIIASIKKEINLSIDFITRYIKNDKKGVFNSSCSEVLIESLESVKLN